MQENSPSKAVQHLCTRSTFDAPINVQTIIILKRRLKRMKNNFSIINYGWWVCNAGISICI